MRTALLICTRNRLADLQLTLPSVMREATRSGAAVWVVDSSDPEPARKVERLTLDAGAAYLRFEGRPSLARQRNAGVRAVPPETEYVLFVDDDVTLEAGYIKALVGFLDRHPDAAGAGGLLLDEVRPLSPASRGLASWFRQIFLISPRRPGGVAISGGESMGQWMDLREPTEVDWLSSCSVAYRRGAIEREPAEDRLEGYSLDEDIDLSYRIGHLGPLYVVPAARLLHRTSPSNRYDLDRMWRERVVHRYWFVEKNIRHPLRKPAFWWMMAGRLLNTVLSPHPDQPAIRRGLLHGMRDVWRRNHDLLR
ncbi:MAG: glycosyltransferase [Bacteroidota bacterium]